MFFVKFTHTVMECGITAWLGQQQLDYLHMAMLAGAHERRGTLIILDVDVSTAGQQCLHHVHPTVTDCQHQPRLSSLEDRVKEVKQPQKASKRYNIWSL